MNNATANPTTEAYTVRIVANPGFTPDNTQPWLDQPTVPALIDDATGKVMRYLGFGTTLDDAATAASEVMAGWARPRHTVATVHAGDEIRITTVVGPVIG